MQEFIYVTNPSIAINKAILTKPFIPQGFVKKIRQTVYSLILNHKEIGGQKWFSTQNIGIPPQQERERNGARQVIAMLLHSLFV
jgi:hypothetical protein